MLRNFKNQTFTLITNAEWDVLLIKITLIRATMRIFSCLDTSCEIVSGIKWKIMRHICLDIYRLTFKGYDHEESESRFEFLKSASEVWIGYRVIPTRVTQRQKQRFHLCDFMVWLHRNHPVFGHRYYKEITLKHPEHFLSTSRLAWILVSEHHAEQKESQSHSERE